MIMRAWMRSHRSEELRGQTPLSPGGRQNFAKDVDLELIQQEETVECKVAPSMPLDERKVRYHRTFGFSSCYCSALVVVGLNRECKDCDDAVHGLELVGVCETPVRVGIPKTRRSCVEAGTGLLHDDAVDHVLDRPVQPP